MRQIKAAVDRIPNILEHNTQLNTPGYCINSAVMYLVLVENALRTTHVCNNNNDMPCPLTGRFFFCIVSLVIEELFVSKQSVLN